MKLIYFAQYFPPEKAAGLPLIEDLLEGYVKAGFEVNLFTPMPTRGITPEERAVYMKKKIEKKKDGKLTIHRMALYREGKGFFNRALRYAIFSLECLYVGLTKPGDIVFTGSGPPTQGLIVGLVRKFTKKKFVYNLQDIFPDSLVNAGITSEGSFLWKIGRKMEDFTYRQSDVIIVISEDFKKNIIAKGVTEEKIVVVPNWFNCKIHPIERKENKLFPKFGLNPRNFYICYSGNIGYTQNMDLLVRTAELIKDSMPDVAFIVVGEGEAKADFEKKIMEKKLNNIILLPFQPYEDLSHVFSLGDAGLVISKAGVGENSIPSKTWDIMAAKRPVIASFDKKSELTKIINNVGCGIAVPPDDSEMLAEAIKKLKHSSEACYQCGLKGKKYLEEYLDRDACVGVYVRTIIDIVKREA